MITDLDIYRFDLRGYLELPQALTPTAPRSASTRGSGGSSSIAAGLPGVVPPGEASAGASQEQGADMATSLPRSCWRA
jgi:hypothetical protein